MTQQILIWTKFFEFVVDKGFSYVCLILHLIGCNEFPLDKIVFIFLVLAPFSGSAIDIYQLKGGEWEETKRFRGCGRV